MKLERNTYLEIAFLLITVILKFTFNDWLNFKAYFILAVCLFWLVYLYRKYKKYPEIIRIWGFQKKHFKESFLFLLPFAILSISGILIYGFYNHSDIFNWHVGPIFFLYPIWGLIQQFMIIGLVVGNLMAMKFIKLKNYQIALVASLLFGLVHYPSSFLMIYAFIMEMLFIMVYLKWRNLWSLALFHGWISGFLLFYVLERDLLIELLEGLW